MNASSTWIQDVQQHVYPVETTTCCDHHAGAAGFAAVLVVVLAGQRPGRARRIEGGGGLLRLLGRPGLGEQPSRLHLAPPAGSPAPAVAFNIYSRPLEWMPSSTFLGPSRRCMPY